MAAINAEKDNLGTAKTGTHQSHTENEQQPVVKSGDEYTYVEKDDKEEPAIPKAQPEVQEHLESDSDDRDTEEIPIAGRTKMTVPKEKGREGSEAGAEADVVRVHAEEEKRKQEQHEKETKETKDELNNILKRSPSEFDSY